VTKVITYGTYDLLHYGHIRLLKRAKALGDYLIVGVTSDDFDKSRGKINVQQSLGERMEAIMALGIADEVIVEEYEGQKIDDIRRYNIDVFTVGSDWEGKFDYLKEYCQVIYLERTEGVSSSGIRTTKRKLRIGLMGDPDLFVKFVRECAFVNGVDVAAVCTDDIQSLTGKLADIPYIAESYDDLLDTVEAVYIASHPSARYGFIKKALTAHKHVLCELPLALQTSQCTELYGLAARKGCILMGAVKTAYATAYSRLLLLVKEGRIGQVTSIDATCTRIKKKNAGKKRSNAPSTWNSIYSWGPTALLPVFHVLGCNYQNLNIVSRFTDQTRQNDCFTKIDFMFKSAVASVKVANGVKSEGELIISGTGGYVYVPAPWWKTDYFEIRYEDIKLNRRYFYQLDGEGIRYEIAAFAKAVEGGRASSNISEEVAAGISKVVELFFQPGFVNVIM